MFVLFSVYVENMRDDTARMKTQRPSDVRLCVIGGSSVGKSGGSSFLLFKNSRKKEFP